MGGGILGYVRQPRDARFNDERRHYALRHCCEDCVYFEPTTGGCRHFWPNDEHRRAFYATVGRQPAWIVFCKEFELA